MNKNNKIRDILLAISLIGVVGLSIGVIILKNKSNSTVLEKEEITEPKVSRKIEFSNVKKHLLDGVLGLKTIQDKFNDILNITKKEEFDKKEEENKFKILKDEILKVLGEYIDVILKSEENKENKDEYFQIINEFKKLITVEFLKEKIGHIKFEDKGSKSTGIFKTIEEEKEEIYNLFVKYFENLKNEEKKYFLSSKEEDKENEFAKLGISKKFKGIFSWFKEEKSYDNKFSQMENIEQIKLIEEKSDSETADDSKETTDSNDETKKGDSEVKTKIKKTDESKKATLIKENKDKKQYTVNGILLTGENSELSETNEQFLERKVKYEFIKYFKKNIEKMNKFDLINNFVQNEKFNDELIKKMFEINEENEIKKDGSSFEFKFDGKETFKNETFLKVLSNEFDKDKNNVKKIKRIIGIIKTEVKENINLDVLLNVDVSNLSSDVAETQKVIDLLKQIQERSKSEENTIGLTGERGLQGLQGLQGPKGDKGEKGEKGEKGLDADTSTDGFTSSFESSEDGSLGKRLADLDTKAGEFDASFKSTADGTLGKKIADLVVKAGEFDTSFKSTADGTLGKKIADLVVKAGEFDTSFKSTADGTLGGKLVKLQTEAEKFDLSFKGTADGTLGGKLVDLDTKAGKFDVSFSSTAENTLGKKLADLYGREYKINLKKSLLKLRLNTFVLKSNQTTVDYGTKVNQEFVIIYKRPQSLTGTTWSPLVFYIEEKLTGSGGTWVVDNFLKTTPEDSRSITIKTQEIIEHDLEFDEASVKTRLETLVNDMMDNNSSDEPNKLLLLSNVFKITKKE